jgi:hypothetical protein
MSHITEMRSNFTLKKRAACAWNVKDRTAQQPLQSTLDRMDGSAVAIILSKQMNISRVTNYWFCSMNAQVVDARQ